MRVLRNVFVPCRAGHPCNQRDCRRTSLLLTVRLGHTPTGRQDGGDSHVRLGSLT
jgi:hypothetical protein